MPIAAIVDDKVGDNDTGGVRVTEACDVITNGVVVLTDGGTAVTDTTVEDSEEDAGPRVGAAGRGVGVTAAFGVGDGTGVGVGAGVGVGIGVGVGAFVGIGVCAGVGVGSVPEGVSPAKLPYV